MSGSKLLKSGMIYTLGSLLLQGLSFITLPIYTRIISQEVFGQYSLYVSWVGIFGLFIGLQTSGSLNIAKVKYSEHYNTYASHALSVSTVVFFLVFFLSFLFQTPLSDFLGFPEQIVLILIVQSFLGYVSGFFGQYFIQLQKATTNFLLSAMTAISTVALSLFLLAFLEDDFLARVYGGFIPLFIMALVTYSYIFKIGKSFIKREYLSFTLAISVPLIFHLLGHQLLNQLDRIMIGKWMTSRDVALYSFGYNLGMLMQIVLGNLNTAWVPWYFEAKRKNNPAIKEYIYRYLAVGLFLTLGYLTIFPELVSAMGGEKYQASGLFISLIIVSYFLTFLYTFPVNIQFYHENTKIIPIGTLFAGLINGILNYLSIPKFGIFGAAIATILSYLSLLLAHHFISKKLYRYDDVSLSHLLFLGGIAFGYGQVMTYFYSSIWIRWGLGLLVVAIYLMLFRKEILYVMKRRK